MTLSPERDLEELRAATACPTWVQTNYAIEKTHTNVLAAALNKGGRPAAHRLAAALWNLTGAASLDADLITKVAATPEHRLKPGPQGTVDLLIEIDAGRVARRLAIEVKVDSVPGSGQLASMHSALGDDPHRRLALLCLGASQVNRIEPDGSTTPGIPRWTIAHVLGLRELIGAAAPMKADVEAWLAELGREEKRRTCAWMDPAALGECGYRGRLLMAYRYGEAARDLEASGSTWEVSLQPFGVILHGKSSHREIPGTTVILYLEVAERSLRVKSGAWRDKSDALAAAEPLRARIAEGFTARGFAVKMARRKRGTSVTLMTIDADADAWPREAFVDRLRRALDVWSGIDLDRPRP